MLEDYAGIRRVVLACGTVDLRKGIDGLAMIIGDKYKQKAIGKGNQKAIQSSVAYKALMRMATIYKLEGALKDLFPEERLKERHASIKPLVEEFFAWVKEQATGGSVLPKGETARGLNYCINQEEHLKVFLTDGEVPIDDSACLCA